MKTSLGSDSSFSMFMLEFLFYQINIIFYLIQILQYAGRKEIRNVTRKEIALGLRKMTPVLLAAGQDCSLEMMDAQDKAVRILEGKTRIYVLSETNNAKKTVCISEDIVMIRQCICNKEFFNPEKYDHPSLEIWEEGKLIESVDGVTVLMVIARELRQN